MGAKASYCVHKMVVLRRGKGVRKEMLGSVAQTRGDARRGEERRDKERFSESG